MQSITLNFRSFALLAAALPALTKLEGLVEVGASTVASNVGNDKPAAQTANTSRTAEVAVADAPAKKDEPSASNEPSFTFKQVGDALQAYHKKDGAAFGAAMKKFGFSSMKDVEAAPGKWNDLMVYIGAAEPATETAQSYTFAQVSEAVQAYTKTVDQATFMGLMKEFGFKNMKDVEAAPGKWAQLMDKIKA